MDYMQKAIRQAQKAYAKGEIPVGAVLVRAGKIIASAHNTKEHTQNALHHAEILAINKACKKLKSWRLDDCDMYVTLEPCPMCAGAILSSRIKTLHIATLDEKYGSAMSKYQLLSDHNLNHNTEIVVGECENEAKTLLSDFFHNLRKNNK